MDILDMRAFLRFMVAIQARFKNLRAYAKGKTTSSWLRVSATNLGPANLILFTSLAACGSESPPALQRLYDPESTEAPPGLFSSAALDRNELSIDFGTDSLTEDWIQSGNPISSSNQVTIPIGASLVQIVRVPAGWNYQVRVGAGKNNDLSESSVVPLLDYELSSFNAEGKHRESSLPMDSLPMDSLPMDNAISFTSLQDGGVAQVEVTSDTAALALVFRPPQGKPLDLIWLRLARARHLGEDFGAPYRLQLKDDERWVQPIAPNNPWEIETLIGESKPRFSTGLALLRPGPSKSAQVRVSIDDEVLLEVTIESAELSSVATWTDIDVPLSRFGGKRHRLSVTTELEESNSQAADSVLVLGSPRILSAVSDRKSNVFIISIDTLRADRLGTYGYNRATSPNIDSWAKRGTVIECVHSTSGYTLPAHASLFTGQYPSTHGATDGYTPIYPSVSPSLTEAIANEGYATLASTSDGFLSPFFGFSRGFDSYTTSDRFTASTRPSSLLSGLEEFVDRIETLGEVPFFAFLHTFSVHDYRAEWEDIERLGTPKSNDPDGYRNSYVALVQQQKENYRNADPADVDRLSDLYDAAISVMDTSLGFLLNEMDRRGLMKNTILILTSDHGEEFYEHGGLLHGHSIHEEVVRVPCIILGPGVPKDNRVSGPMSLADLGPTVLQALGISRDSRMDGNSVWDHIQKKGDGNKTLISEIEYKGYLHMSIMQNRFRAMRKRVGDKRSFSIEYDLFDKKKDPGEQDDVSRMWPQALRDMIQELDETRDEQGEWRRVALPSDALNIEMPESLVEELRKLGYSVDAPVKGK